MENDQKAGIIGSIVPLILGTIILILLIFELIKVTSGIWMVISYGFSIGLISMGSIGLISYTIFYTEEKWEKKNGSN